MTSPPRVPAVASAASVLSWLSSQSAPRHLRDITNATGIPKSSLRRICLTLVEARMLAEGADGSFWLGPHVLELGASFHRTSRGSLRIGLLIPNRDNEFYTALLSGAEDRIDAAGGDLHLRHASDEAETQQLQWRELLDLGVDAILIDAVDSRNLGPLVDLSHQRGVVVVAFGSRLDGVDGSVTSDNIQAGLMAGQLLAQRVRRGRVAIVDGLRKNANADRVAGFKEVMRDYPDVEIVAHIYGDKDDRESGRAAAAALLTGDDEIDGVFAVCDPLAFGVADHLASRNSTIPITSIDGRAEAVAQITSGGPIIGTAAQDPGRIMDATLRTLVSLFHGEPASATQLLPVRLVNASNAGSYQPWG